MAEQVQVTDRNQELLQLYPRNPKVILVAGQALATWVEAFGLPIPDALQAGITYDIDILGDQADALQHFELLKQRGLVAKLLLPKPNDITPNTAKLLVSSAGADDVKAEIDYLGSVYGFNGKEVDLVRRSIQIVLPDDGTTLSVMHPFDCLKSRIHNLVNLPSKRNDRGVAQCHLAIAVVREYLRQITSEEHRPRDIVLPIAESVIVLACHRDGTRVFHEHEIDVLSAIPEHLYPALFRERRWPQAEKYVRRRRFGRKGGRLR